MADLDLRPGAQRPITRYHQSMDKIGEFLSPAEAEFAYEGAEKENFVLPDRNSRPMSGKIDSPLDVIDEEHLGRPLVSPLDNAFPLPPSSRPRDTVLSSASTLLPFLNEHIREIVPIFIELRTNVIVKDEFSLVTKLSSLLAQTYCSSEDGVIINVDHSACLMLAGSFDPAYMLTITTTPSQLDHDINGSNTIQIQRLMHQLLSVPAHRGLLRFHAILEENVGMAGTTVATLNHRTPRQLYDARQTIPSGSVPETEGFGVANGSNPVAPAANLANKVLRQQISSMSVPDRKLSLRSDVSDLTIAARSPRPDFLDSAPSNEHRRHHSDMVLNFHKPRPISTYSSRFREDSVDWRPTMPTPSNEDQQLTFFPSGTETSSIDDAASEDSGISPPPPIPHNRSEASSVKARKRRSLFAVFKR
ncbi:hypothetical protein B9Z65_3111 [Elsinoe australis]|uniref:L-dopachrome isomerase n=1 Tax=Elsinoe australis TaxID=40998 RepID=A0A2P7ZUE7_9PEZI|nr:hypothetical protein B9Z65_3111 [Elsinoe australis]